jgi:hypothetical protein
MGDSFYRLKDGENIPVEPLGADLAQGWLPGTWVKWSTTAPSTYSGAMGAVERSDGTGTLAGFLMNGPQHLTPQEKLSDMWNMDSLQRDGGEMRQNFGAYDASPAFVLDPIDKLLNRGGTRIVQMFIPPTGYHRHFVYETVDLAERTTPTSGSALTYTPGDKLYVSNRGRLTSEMESGSHTWTGYVVARFAADELMGMYILAVAAVA